jgi:hypothetical protein
MLGAFRNGGIPLAYLLKSVMLPIQENLGSAPQCRMDKKVQSGARTHRLLVDVSCGTGSPRVIPQIWLR